MKHIQAHYILFVLFLALITACDNSEVKGKRNHGSVLNPEKEPAKSSEDKKDGTMYSDSMIALLSKPKESRKIDSFHALHSFDKAKFQWEHCNEFTIELLMTLEQYGMRDDLNGNYPKVTEPQRNLLGVTEYLCDRSFSDDFDMYVFHSADIESHYSNSIQLVTISKTSNKYSNLVLSQRYMSEAYEYDISSHFIAKNKLELTKVERFNTSNLSSQDDSISYSKLQYFINEEGEFIMN